MKFRNVVVVAAILVAGLIGYNFFTTGSFSLIPSQGLSQNERTIKDLEDRLADARKQYSQAARTASVSGIDTTADAEAALRGVQMIQKELTELRARLTEDSEIREADKLADALHEFSKTLR